MMALFPACGPYARISSTGKIRLISLQPDHRWLELQLRMLLEQVEQFENIVGFFWVIEWTADHGFMRMRFSGSIVRGVKKIYPFARSGITECWRSITYNSGSAHRCTYQPHYTYNINIPVRQRSFWKASIIFAVPCIIWRKKNKRRAVLPTAAMKFLNVLLGRPRKAPHFWKLGAWSLRSREHSVGKTHRLD